MTKPKSKLTWQKLNNKSLKTAWEWAENNEQRHPLADAYIGACVVVASVGGDKIWDAIKETWKGRDKSGYIAEAHKPYDMAFMLRDTIGRMILDMLKRK